MKSKNSARLLFPFSLVSLASNATKPCISSISSSESSNLSLPPSTTAKRPKPGSTKVCSRMGGKGDLLLFSLFISSSSRSQAFLRTELNGRMTAPISPKNVPGKKVPDTFSILLGSGNTVRFPPTARNTNLRRKCCTRTCLRATDDHDRPHLAVRWKRVFRACRSSSASEGGDFGPRNAH